MYSEHYVIDENILENYFHIYNPTDRILVLSSLRNEKIKIDIFLNSNKFKENKNFGALENLCVINMNNYIYYNNFDIYFNAKESQETSCKICIIF